VDANVVLIGTWTCVGLIIAGYIWFVVWRYRAEQRKKAAKAAAELKERSVLAATPVPATGVTPAPTAATPEPVVIPQPDPTPDVVEKPIQTVAELLSGIQLPHDLVPITMMAPRDQIGDRVAFSTDGIPADAVGKAFGDELERLGYTITPTDEARIRADRGSDHLLCQVHLDARYAILGDRRAFPAVPDGSVVVEVWIPL
jgi:hypothetical protein